MLLIRKKKLIKIIQTIYDRALHYSNSFTFLCTFLLDFFLFIKNNFFLSNAVSTYLYLIFILSQMCIRCMLEKLNFPTLLDVLNTN